ncbi:hypothetical protein SAMN05216553_106150 [Lentzea fradiae]|uniref:Uncharacterized protein n=1 Tax=Lentzea fradiae TaxID=200378 RepID=A0A1G7SB96_9PSEU|nr:hypothetical protein [Lentzea fradiae]SDG20204.1 hypothetical protein SAMN05216553_106150 [Lentzea fradiae]
MNITPDVPQLDPLRVQVRKHALLTEIDEKPSRRWWRIAVPATTLVAAAAAVMVLWTPTNPNASASWSAEPRAPGADTEAAVADCRTMIEEHDRREKPANFPAAPTEVSVVDQRGIMTLALFTGPQSELLCRHVQGGRASLTGSGRAEGLEPLGDELFRSFGASTHSERDGSDAMRIFRGEVSGQVGKAVVETENGLEVTATIGDGWLIAWWPGKEDAKLVRLYDRQGTEIGTAPAGIR